MTVFNFYREFDGVRAPERGTTGSAGIDFWVPSPDSLSDRCFNFMREACLNAAPGEDAKAVIERRFQFIDCTSQQAFLEAVNTYDKYVFGLEKKMILKNDGVWSMCLSPGDSVVIPSGISIDLPRGWCLDFCNKSGIATKSSLLVGAELVDEDYSGIMHFDIHNVGRTQQYITCGKKLVQGVLQKTWLDEIEISTEDGHLVKRTERGTGGFGSTGA